MCRYETESFKELSEISDNTVEVKLELLRASMIFNIHNPTRYYKGMQRGWKTEKLVSLQGKKMYRVKPMRMSHKKLNVFVSLTCELDSTHEYDE